MNSAQFEYLRAFLKKQSGLMLGDDKRYLIDSRLTPVAKELGLNTVADLINALRRPGATRIADKVTEAMTINESFFYRDIKPFENFRNIMLPAMLEARRDSKRLRIWSAAASTGQEAYSLAIEIREQQARMAGWRTEILGTDLCNDALTKARNGIYSQFEVQRGMPTPLLMKYFEQRGVDWQIKPEIRNMVQYRHFNLLNNYRTIGTFDIVFCRNVLIYFDRETKADILKRLSAILAKDGFLVLGAAETIVGLSEDYKSVPGAYGLYQHTTTVDESAPKARTPVASWKKDSANERLPASGIKPIAPLKVGTTGSAFTSAKVGSRLTRAGS
jgi:chemotaxis protein methyltransferase CheR